MPCPICKALHRDHNRECELEAKTTIQQRFRLFSSSRPESPAAGQETGAIVLNSRKRQVRIASRLDLHKASHHTAYAAVVSAPLEP